MSRRTYTRNAFEGTLSAGVSAGAVSIPLDSTLGLVAPLYLVIDHADPAKREYIRAASIAGSTLEGVTRGLDGGNPGVAHDSGARIRAVFAQQMLQDLFDDIEDLEDEDSDHSAAADPHPQYLTVIEGNLAYAPAVAGGYLPLSGGLMTGGLNLGGNALTNAVISASTIAGYLPLAGGVLTNFLTLHADPTAALHAATKQYVDAGLGAIPPADWDTLVDKPATFPPSAHVHAAADVSSGIFDVARIPDLAAAKITSGIFAIARIPTGTTSTTVSLGNHTHAAYAPLASPTFTGIVEVPAGSAASPSFVCATNVDTGMFWTGSAIGFSSDGDETLRITSGGLNTYTRVSGKSTADYLEWDNTNHFFQFYLVDTEVLRLEDGGAASSLRLMDGLSDVGNVEVLRMNRGTGTGVVAVGYFSSRAAYKTGIIPLAQSPRFPGLDVIDQIRPVDFKRKSTKEREWGFIIDELEAADDNLRYLTTKGDKWGDSLDEFGLLAVAYLGLQDLRSRVAALEA